MKETFKYYEGNLIFRIWVLQNRFSLKAPYYVFLRH